MYQLVHGISADTGYITFSMVHQHRRGVSPSPWYIKIDWVYQQRLGVTPSPWYINTDGVYHLTQDLFLSQYNLWIEALTGPSGFSNPFTASSDGSSGAMNREKRSADKFNRQETSSGEYLYEHLTRFI
jgi:hypothetical protein